MRRTTVIQSLLSDSGDHIKDSLSVGVTVKTLIIVPVMSSTGTKYRLDYISRGSSKIHIAVHRNSETDGRMPGIAITHVLLHRKDVKMRMLLTSDSGTCTAY